MLTLLPRRRIASRVPSTSSLRRSTLCWCQRRLRPSVLTRDGRGLLCHDRRDPFPSPLDTTADLGSQALSDWAAPRRAVADDGRCGTQTERRRTRHDGRGRRDAAVQLRRLACSDGSASRESLAGADSAADAERRRGLRRMKVVALSLPGRRHGDLPGLHLGPVPRRRRLGRLRPRRGRSGHGRRAGRLVRGHRAVQTSAGHPDPAHRDHQAQEGPARRGSRHVRPGELHVAGSGGDQTARRRGRRPARQMARPSRRTPSGSQPKHQRRCGFWWRCCATRTSSTCWTG